MTILCIMLKALVVDEDDQGEHSYHSCNVQQCRSDVGLIVMLLYTAPRR